MPKAQISSWLDMTLVFKALRMIFFLTKFDRRKYQHFHTVDGPRHDHNIDHLMECFYKKRTGMNNSRTWSHIQREFHFRRSQQEKPSFNYHNNLQAQERPRNLGASPLSKGHFGANRNDLSLPSLPSQSRHYRSPQWMGTPGGSNKRKTHRLHHDLRRFSFFLRSPNALKHGLRRVPIEPGSNHERNPRSQYSRTTWDFRKPHEITWNIMKNK